MSESVSQWVVVWIKEWIIEMLSMYIKTEIYFTIDISISKYFLPNNQVYRFLFGLNNWKLQYQNTYNNNHYINTTTPIKAWNTLCQEVI